MHLAVIDVDPDVTGIRACQRSNLHLLHDTLEDGWHEARVNGAADNTVHIDELAAPREVYLLLVTVGQLDFLAGYLHHRLGLRTFLIGFDDHMNLAELACAARLLLVTVVGLRCLGDGLTVGDLGSKVLRLDLEDVVKMPFEDIEMVLTLAVDDDLLELLGVLDEDRRVFLVHAAEGLTHLLLVTLAERLDGSTVLGLGELHVLKGPVVARGIERMVCLGVLQLHKTADVTGMYLRYARTVLTGADEDL